MDDASSCSSEYDDRVALEGLYEAFGSIFSLQDITSAYVDGGCNADMAGEILYGLQERNLKVSTNGSAGECSSSAVKLKELVLENNSEKTAPQNKNHKVSKPKKISFSIGTVSSVLGRGYVKPASGINGSCKTSKPLSKNELWRDVSVLDSAQRNQPINKLEMDMIVPDSAQRDINIPDSAHGNQPINNNETEKFLFEMLGDGFQLDMDTIKEVFGACGYDAKKSMDKLLDKSKDILDDKDRNLSDAYSEESSSSQKSLPSKDFAQRNRAESPCMDKEKYNLSKEVLGALFTVPERCEEAPKRKLPVKAVKRTRSLGKVVTAPLDDDLDPLPVILEPQQDTKDEDDNYLVLRKVVKENWDAMEAYYGAALDAFLKGERDKANYLLEEGKAYYKKAREVDEMSAREIVKPRNEEVQNIVTLDLREHELRDAVRLLRLHLKSLANIPSIVFLKVLLETKTEDISRGTRKRILVMKVLEKENIKWSEEENSGTMSIRVDEIDPENLSFAKKL